MTADPKEGIDREGFLTTGVDARNVEAPYERVVADARDTICATLAEDLHGLYIYGSVATGEATPPDSDLDLAAIVKSESAKHRCIQLSRDLSNRHHGTVSEVGVAAALLKEVLAPDLGGQAERCFLKHYCAHITGIDLRPKLTPCQPNRAIARGFIGDLAGDLEELHRRSDSAETEAELRILERVVSRRLLLAAAVLYSVVEGTWTTDRTAGARRLSERYPERSREAMLALSLSRRSPLTAGGADHVDDRAGSGSDRDFLFELGHLIARDVRHHLST